MSWFKNSEDHVFRIRRKRLLGLDIGSSMVKLVELETTSQKLTVNTAAQAPIEVSVDPATATPVYNAANAVRHCLLASAARVRKAACAVGGPQVAVRRFAFASLKAGELPQAVRMEAAQSCPFDMDKSVVGYHVVKKCSAGWPVKRRLQHEGLLVAAVKDAVQQKEQIAGAAGADCVLMDAEGLAVLNCLTACGRLPREGTTIVANVGSTNTNVIVTAPGAVPCIRDLRHDTSCAVGGLTDDRLLGCDRPRSVDTWLASLCERLAREIDYTVRFCAAEDRLPPVQETLLCGGLVLSDGFVRCLEERIGRHCAVWNPFMDLGCSRRVESAGMFERGPAFAVATGLALRRLGDIYD